VILAAGLSPAWQQIVVLDRLSLGEVNRAREVRWCASGKVINAGLALHRLLNHPPLSKHGPGGVASPKPTGDEQAVPRCASRTLTLVGGLTGEALRRDLAELEVPVHLIDTASATRVCTTILDRQTGTTTELVENVGPIDDEELRRFKEAYRAEARAAEVVVLTGSFPAGAPTTLYRELLEGTPGRAVVDAQGEPLLAALDRRPFMVKPNREELGRTLGRRLETDGDLHSAMREICRRGASWAVVTQGKRPVWIGSERELFSVQPPSVDVVNPIGSGDCFAAALAVALARGNDIAQAVAYGIAAASENCRQLLPARLDSDRVQLAAADIHVSRTSAF
jgi:1-phosphofructokinase family hexose kinase